MEVKVDAADGVRYYMTSVIPSWMRKEFLDLLMYKAKAEGKFA